VSQLHPELQEQQKQPTLLSAFQASLATGSSTDKQEVESADDRVGFTAFPH
jgi:hypothetical protein